MSMSFRTWHENSFEVVVCDLAHSLHVQLANELVQQVLVHPRLHLAHELAKRVLVNLAGASLVQGGEGQAQLLLHGHVVLCPTVRTLAQMHSGGESDVYPAAWYTHNSLPSHPHRLAQGSQ